MTPNVSKKIMDTATKDSTCIVVMLTTGKDYPRALHGARAQLHYGQAGYQREKVNPQ